jgi:hypothetical protein
MDWTKILKLLPVVAGSVNPMAGVIAQAIETLAEEEIAKKMAADPSLTRDQVIDNAGAKWGVGLDKATAGRKLGHEADMSEGVR